MIEVPIEEKYSFSKFGWPRLNSMKVMLKTKVMRSSKTSVKKTERQATSMPFTRIINSGISFTRRASQQKAPKHSAACSDLVKSDAALAEAILHQTEYDLGRSLTKRPRRGSLPHSNRNISLKHNNVQRRVIILDRPEECASY